MKTKLGQKDDRNSYANEGDGKGGISAAMGRKKENSRGNET